MDSKILVIGSSGMLGQALKQEIEHRPLIFTGIAKGMLGEKDIDVDITDDKALTAALDETAPDIIINTAAIVDCNVCENDPGLAYRINARPSALLADWSKKHNVHYVYISTDHYYIGDENQQHKEDAPITLINEYARTKYLGEILTLTNPNTLVVRTNIVGFRGWGTPTFVEWAVAALKNGEPMTLFDDYFISSIPVSLFAPALCDLVTQKTAGVINLASRETFSKKAFIESLAKTMNLPLHNVKTGSVRSLQTNRAESAGLDVSKAEALLQRKLPTLEQAVQQLAVDFLSTSGDNR